MSCHRLKDCLQSNSNKNCGRSILDFVTSPLWRHRVMWRHRWRHHSTPRWQYPIRPRSPVFWDTVCIEKAYYPGIAMTMFLPRHALVRAWRTSMAWHVTSCHDMTWHDVACRHVTSCQRANQSPTGLYVCMCVWLQIWQVYSQGLSEHKQIKNLGEKGAWAYIDGPIFWVPPSISGTVKATNVKYCMHILVSIGTKALYKLWEQ